jgi:uncharacterized OsmC-like protein
VVRTDEQHRDTTAGTVAEPAIRRQRNGVDAAAWSATADAVAARPDLARFQFRARSEWRAGAHCRTTIDEFHGAGEERSHEGTFRVEADQPAVLVGRDQGPTPVEFVLHALASCLTAGLARSAAARDITLHRVTSTVTGELDLRGMLGLDPQVRAGCRRIDVRFAVEADASAEEVGELIAAAQTCSSVHDMLTSAVPVHVEVELRPPPRPE